MAFRLVMKAMTILSKSQIKRLYEELIEQFCKWAENRDDIRAAVILGSRARVDHPADEWSDLDVVIITKNPEHYVSTADWVSNFRKPILTFIEPTASGNEKERRVLYEDMLDVDFAIVPLQKAQAILGITSDHEDQAGLSNLLGRGFRVLLDKDGMLRGLISSSLSADKHVQVKPTEEGFLAIVNDFLYHAVFAAKHLRRGELWWTVTCLDGYMQDLLLRIIEWHAISTKGEKRDTWFRGRFLEEWADAKALKGLHQAFAHYDVTDVKRALLASISLFRDLATETAANMNYPYPGDASGKVTAWISAVISEA